MGCAVSGSRGLLVRRRLQNSTALHNPTGIMVQLCCAIMLLASLATGQANEGDDQYVDCDVHIFLSKKAVKCSSDDSNEPLYSGSCAELLDNGVSKALSAAAAEYPPLALVAPVIIPLLVGLIGDTPGKA